METILKCVTGLDVPEAQVTACLWVTDGTGRSTPHLAEFTETVQCRLTLADEIDSTADRSMCAEPSGVMPGGAARVRRAPILRRGCARGSRPGSSGRGPKRRTRERRYTDATKRVNIVIGICRFTVSH
jgi:hypothetical protein